MRAATLATSSKTVEHECSSSYFLDNEIYSFVARQNRAWALLGGRVSSYRQHRLKNRLGLFYHMSRLWRHFCASARHVRRPIA